MIFLIHIFVHTVQPLSLLHCDSVLCVSLNEKMSVHNTGPKVTQKSNDGCPRDVQTGKPLLAAFQLEVTYPTERSGSLLATPTRPECRTLQKIGTLYEPIG